MLGHQCAHLYQHPNFNPEKDRETGYRTRSVLCCPFRDSDGEIIGAIQLINRRASSILEFSNEDASVLDTIAIPIGLAIANFNLTAKLAKTEDMYLNTQIKLTKMRKSAELASGLSSQLSQVSPPSPDSPYQ